MTNPLPPKSAVVLLGSVLIAFAYTVMVFKDEVIAQAVVEASHTAAD